MDLNALREFAAVAGEGSFTAAARRLGTPKSTVSKRVQDLENALGVRLLERTTRSVRLTAEGALVLARAQRILADADDLSRALGDGAAQASGHLRLAAPVLFGQVFLGRLAALCRARNPGVTVEVVLSDSLPDLIEGGFDAAIRPGAPTETHAIARPLATVQRIAVAAAGVLDAPLSRPEALTDLPVVLEGVGLVQTWHLTDGHRDCAVRVAGGLTLSTPAAVREAVLAGAGVALLPAYFVQPDLSDGTLCAALPGWGSPPERLSLVYPDARALTRRLQVLLEVLQDCFPEADLTSGSA